jgi:hypothetical protein
MKRASYEAPHEKCEIHTKFWSEYRKGRYRRRWEDNIRMDLMNIGWEVVE